MSSVHDLKTEDEFVQYQGRSIFVRKYIVNQSDQIEMVFLHDGLACTESLGDFPSQMCLELGKNGISYDRIGHGKSEGLSTPRTIKYLTDAAGVDLPSILKYYGIEKPGIVGSGDGASIGLLYASEFETDFLIALTPLAMVEELTINGVNETFVKLNESEEFKNLEHFHGDKALKLLVDWASIWLSEEFRSWNIIPELDKITCPTLVIHGSHDVYVSKNQCKIIADSIGKNCQFSSIETAGHLLQGGNTQKVIQICKDFLSSV